MRVFVTGASGCVGSAVTRELIDAGHEVVGLARSDASAAALTAAGAEVHRGALDDLDSLRAGAAAADGVIHLAYAHDFSQIANSGAMDFRAVEAMLAALEGSGKPFVGTSGTLVVAPAAPGRPATEEDQGPTGLRRVDSENATVAMAERGVRSSVVRLAPSVHGEGDKHGFVPSLIGFARAKGVSPFVGDGSNRWPGVHRLDAAHLFRLALEAAPAGSRLHGAGEPGVPFRDIAAAIGRMLDVPVASIAPDAAAGHFGFLSEFVQIDNPTSSALTRELLGWNPGGPGLIADIEQRHYFAGNGDAMPVASDAGTRSAAGR
jgi:nucleoside-diphosphate-sugar epimerase